MNLISEPSLPPPYCNANSSMMSAYSPLGIPLSCICSITMLFQSASPSLMVGSLTNSVIDNAISSSDVFCATWLLTLRAFWAMPAKLGNSWSTIAGTTFHDHPFSIMALNSGFLLSLPTSIIPLSSARLASGVGPPTLANFTNAAVCPHPTERYFSSPVTGANLPLARATSALFFWMLISLA